jgi:hypothetical protein
MKLLMESDIGTTVKNVAFAGRNPRDYSVYGGSNDTGIALGRVALWGRIVEHELGYRAEYAYPSAIVVVGSEGLTARVKKRYGCETQHDNGTIRAWLIKIRSIRGPQF